MKYLPILLIFLFVILGCGNLPKNQPTTATNQTNNQPTVIVKAEDLTRDYAENEVAADDKYKNRSLEVTGKVSEIAEVGGNLTVQLEGHKENGINLLSVMCAFPEQSRAEISKLKKGQTVTLAGTGDGKTLGFYAGLTNCHVKS